MIPEQSQFCRAVAIGGRTIKTFASNFKISVDWMKVNIGMSQDCFSANR